MVDKSCIRQVLGSLMKHPQFLGEVDKYTFNLTDFPTKFEKYIYTAIMGLYYNGAKKINPIDIVNYLSSDTIAKDIFEKQNGIDYLQDLEELTEVENFDYYYIKLKKINLLNDLKKDGFDTSDFYMEDLTNPKAIEINQKFERLSLQDITNGIKRKLLILESQYEVGEEVETETALEGMEELIQSLGETQDIGMPIQGEIYNEVISGARKGTFTIRSAASGVGKTRNALADACYLAYPIRFNPGTAQWEQSGSCEKVLYIVTEQSFKEVRKMILAYLTGINESRFKYGNFGEYETKLINQALEVMKFYENNLILVKMPNPTIELVKTIVRENCLLKGCEYVFYDYIFIGPALLNEFRGFNIRNDEALLMFATALKDLAVELDVCVMSSTQVNAKGDDNTNIRNESALAGGRATINKADNGAIMARPTKEELEVLGTLIEKYGQPNLVTDVYKVRSGEWTQVRIWSYIDLGTMRKVDLFITDNRLEPVENFYANPHYKMTNWEFSEQEETDRFLKTLNS